MSTETTKKNEWREREVGALWMKQGTTQDFMSGHCSINEEKVELNIEVVRCNYSDNWNTNYVTAIVDDAVVFFASSKKLELGSKLRVYGKVKRHKEDRTQLSHVKLI